MVVVGLAVELSYLSNYEHEEWDVSSRQGVASTATSVDKSKGGAWHRGHTLVIIREVK